MLPSVMLSSQSPHGNNHAVYHESNYAHSGNFSAKCFSMEATLNPHLESCYNGGVMPTSRTFVSRPQPQMDFGSQVFVPDVDVKGLFTSKPFCTQVMAPRGVATPQNFTSFQSPQLPYMHNPVHNSMHGIEELAQDVRMDPKLYMEPTMPPRSPQPQKLVWTSELHQRFKAAVNALGIDEAKPHAIQRLMNVEGVTRYHIKSHLQKYRKHLENVDGTGNFLAEWKTEESAAYVSKNSQVPAKMRSQILQMQEVSLGVQLDIHKRLKRQMDLQRDILSQLQETLPGMGRSQDTGGAGADNEEPTFKVKSQEILDIQKNLHGDLAEACAQQKQLWEQFVQIVNNANGGSDKGTVIKEATADATMSRGPLRDSALDNVEQEGTKLDSVQ